jgi:predicted nucleic acid-binding protein
MSIPVLCDANVLYGNEVRDLLIRIAISGMVRAHWTDEILDETFGNLVANRPDLSPERLMVTRERMNAAVPGALISGYETLVEALKLPDPDDRHVLAAAITAGAAVIVTTNLSDFPAETLEPLGIEAKTPDDFVLDQIGLDEGKIRDCVHQIGRGRTRPPKTYEEILNALERAGLVGSAATLRD